MNDFYGFLKNEVPCNELLAIRSDSAYSFHKNHIRLVISGLDLWNHESPQATTVRHIVLTKYGSLPSTQHNNERLVKISLQIARTGKTGQSANHYLISANGFIRDCPNEPSNDTVVNEEEEDGTSNTVERTRMRGISKRTTKLVNIKHHLYHLEQDYSKV